MLSKRAFAVIFLAIFTGATLGAGATIWLLRESNISQSLGFVSSETAASLLAAQQIALEKAQPASDDNRLESIIAKQATVTTDQTAHTSGLAAKVAELSDQISAMNRDLESLRFRVDTHSEGIRPLRQSDMDENSRLRPFTSE